jgi:hypothetical protein
MATVGLGSVEVLDAVLVGAAPLVVLTPEPQADKPAVRASTSGKCRLRSRNCTREFRRGSIISVCICYTKAVVRLPLQPSLIATMINAIQGSAKCRGPRTSQIGDTRFSAQSG